MTSGKIFCLGAALSGLLLCVGVSPCFAREAAIYDINVDVRLQHDGSALVYEHWEVCAVSGTEWYLVKSNLGDIRIEDFGVSDETSRKYTNIGEWDIDRSMEQKARRCGIVTKRNGVELCWGIGSFGDHTFNVRYAMTNCVKALSDYDYLHIQFVSPGLSSRPKHVKVSISFPGESIDTTNARAWGFGYRGDVSFEDGKVVFESSERFSENSSVIALLRFNKGMFSPSSKREGTSFEDVLSVALKGASFEDDSEEDELPFYVIAIMFVGIFFGSIELDAIHTRSRRKRVLGMKPSEVEWSRDIPFEGNIAASSYTLNRLYEVNKPTPALILRLIYTGYLSVNKDDNDVTLSPVGKDTSELDACAKELLGMITEAGGSDGVLGKREFSSWAQRHSERLIAYNALCNKTGRTYLKDKLYTENGDFTPDGQKNARKLLGLRMFLKDFTLIGERETPEVTLWREYLVFGALFGIAETVAKQLKDINTEVFEEEIGYDFPTISHILLLNGNIESSILRARENAGSASRSRGGFGGGASFGGGGGFSGGGCGGGSR